MEGLTAVDFGSGAGRDCFILSKLVGQDGFVTGVDMTQEQVKCRENYREYGMLAIFGGE